MDNACASDKRRIYAPVDVKCVRNLHAQGYGLVLYQSVNKVRLADGSTNYLSMWLMHDNNASQWQVGKIYKQGEHIYTEGNADPSELTTGIHVHYEVAIGLHSDRIKSHPDGRYHIVNQVHPDQVFHKNGTTLKRANAEGSWKGDHTYVWKDFDGGSGGVDPLPTWDKDKLVIIAKNPKDIGGVKVGNIYKVKSNNGKELILELVTQKLKGNLAIIKGGKGKTVPFYNYTTGRKIVDFDLSRYSTWQFLIDEVGGNGDIITKTSAYGKVRINERDVQKYEEGAK